MHPATTDIKDDLFAISEVDGTSLSVCKADLGYPIRPKNLNFRLKLKLKQPVCERV